MSTSQGGLPRRSTKITLKSGETLVLPKPQNQDIIQFDINNGFIRISAITATEYDEITVGFATSTELIQFSYPHVLELKIEAITTTNLQIEYAKKEKSSTLENDYLYEWILQLHTIRHPIKADERLMYFLNLLASRLGKRTSEGLLLEFLLPHGRVAEIIGTTRSTVSRTISTLRKKDTVVIDELKNQILIPIKDLD